MLVRGLPDLAHFGSYDALRTHRTDSTARLRCSRLNQTALKSETPSPWKAGMHV